MHRTVTIFGHQVPVMALVAAAGALGFVLVMRARRGGRNVVSAGSAAAQAAAAAAAATPYTSMSGIVDPTTGQTYGPQFGMNAGTPDYGSQLAAIAAQLAALQAAQQSTPPPTPTPTPTPTPPPPDPGGGHHRHPGDGNTGGPPPFVPPTGGTTDTSFTNTFGGLQGAGYLPAFPSQQVVTPTGTYQWLSGMPQVQAELAAGQSVYIEPLPGQFVPVSWAQIQAESGLTPIYGSIAAGTPGPTTGHPANGTAQTSQMGAATQVITHA